MVDETEVSAPIEPRSEFDIVYDVHNRLKARFSPLQNPEWEPTRENVFISRLRIPPGSALADEAGKKEADPRTETPSLRAGGGFILDDESFNREVGNLLREEIGDSEEVSRMLEEMVGHADFISGRLYVRAGEGGRQTLEYLLGHEILHLWFRRNKFNGDQDLAASYGANETFIDVLALEGLGFYDTDPKEREEQVDLAVENSLIIRAVVEGMGESGWHYLYDACRTGSQGKIAQGMYKSFGDQPPRELRKINKELPIVFGNDFWGRLKEAALMIYLVRQDPHFEEEQPAVKLSTK